MENTEKKRSVYLDTICGILILQVVFITHIASSCYFMRFEVVRFVYLLLIFAMAWFFFKAGMFYKDKPLKDVVKKSARRLLVPWAVFCAVGAAFEIYISQATECRYTRLRKLL